MRLARNMAAGMANSVVLVLTSLVALPFYLRYLGMEAYGLIGFYVTLQTVLQVLDFGLAPTVSRDIAQGMETGRQRRSASLLRTLGVVYASAAIGIAALVAMASPWISAHWLQARDLSGSTVAQAVALMGLSLACRWPLGLYQGALVGAHRLALSSMVSITISIAAAVTTIAVLAWGSRTIQAFFLVQAGFGLLHVTVLRIAASVAVGERDAPYDFGDIRRVWGFSAWMGGIAITSIAFTQLDKVLLSRLIELESFGNYMLAVLLVSGLQVVTGPAFNVIYPKFTTLLERGDIATLACFYSDTSRMFAAAVFSLALGLALHADAIMTLWTGNADVAAHTAPLVVLLATGSALNGIMYFPYALQIASGRPRIPFYINASLLGLAVPTVVWLAMRNGAIGGAMSWAMLGVAYLIIGTVVTGRLIAMFAGMRWLSRDIAPPLALALAPALVGAWLAEAMELSVGTETGIAVLAAGIGIAAGTLYSPFARHWLRDFLGIRARPCPN